MVTKSTVGIATEQRHGHDHRHQRQQDQEVTDLQDGSLKVADAVSGLHQFRGLAEIGVRFGGKDHGIDLTRQG